MLAESPRGTRPVSSTESPADRGSPLLCYRAIGPDLVKDLGWHPLPVGPVVRLGPSLVPPRGQVARRRRTMSGGVRSTTIRPGWRLLGDPAPAFRNHFGVGDSDCRLPGLLIKGARPELRTSTASRPGVAWRPWVTPSPAPVNHEELRPPRAIRLALRVRFGLSLACAVMVAVFWGGNIGLVYPLLQVLIRSQNCQHWVEEKIDSTYSRVAGVPGQARRARRPRPMDDQIEVKLGRLERARRDYDVAEEALRNFRKRLVDVKDRPADDLGLARKNALPSPQERDFQIAEARLEVLRIALPLVKTGQYTDLEYSKSRWARDLEDANRWNWRYRQAEPLIKRYLPDNGFKTLLLVMALVNARHHGQGGSSCSSRTCSSPTSPSSPSSTSAISSSAGRWRWTCPTSTIKARPSCWPGSPTTWSRSSKGWSRSWAG